MYLDYFRESFLSLFSLLKKKRTLVLILVFLQLFMLSLTSYLFVSSQLAVFDALAEANDPLVQLGDIDTDDPGASLDQLLLQSAALQSTYHALLEKLLLFGFWSLLAFLSVEALLWLFSHELVHGGSSWLTISGWKLRMKKYWVWYQKYLASVFLLLFPFFLFSYIFFVNFIDIDLAQFASAARVFLILVLLLFYLLLVAFSSLSIKSWKGFVLRVFVVGIKKIHYALPLLLVCVALFAGAAYLLYWSTLILLNFPLMLLSAFLLFFVLVAARVLFIIGVEKIARMASD